MHLVGSFTWQSVLLAVLIFVVTFAISLAIVSFILVKLPADYFSRSHERKFLDDYRPGVRIAGVIAKNVVGVLLVVVGIILSIPGVPGQGVLTILLGVMLLDFPGKHRLEQNLVCRPKVRDAINALRQKFGKSELVLD